MFGRPANGGGNGRPVCKFFLEGRCRFGDNCKNEHPRTQANQQQSNRFAPLQNSGNPGFRSGATGSNQSSNLFSISEDAIRDDLTTGKERPQWPLSAYGPGVKPPRQLLEGAAEVSPEEMRLLYYLAQASGNPQEYVQHEQRLVQQVNQQVQTILNDIPGAKKYIIDGKDQHPNRNDVLDQPAQTVPKPNPFAQGTPQPGTAGSGFGVPSNPATNRSSFGAPSTMGNSSAFGAPSTLGQASVFGRPATSGGGTGGFGKPSAFGQPATLGQGASAFGGAQQATAFGQAAKPSPFGQPAALGRAPPFAVQTQQSNAFGQPSAFGAASQKPGPFAQAASSQATPVNPFGQATQKPQLQASNAFAQAGQTQQTAGFGIPSSLTSGPNPAASANASTTRRGLPTVTDKDGKSYYEVPDAGFPANKRRERIWHPNGPPGNAHLDAQGPAEAYDGEGGKLLENIYKKVRDTGEFKEAGGLMPEIPPQRDWIGWDL